MGVLVGSSYLLQSVSDEKENRMMEILLTSVSPLALMAGKVLALGTVGLAQLSVWAVSVALIGPRIMDDFPNLGQWSVDPLLLVWMVAFFLAGYFFLGVAMAGIGAATPSYREASQVAIFIYLPSLGLPMWLFMAIAGNPDGQIARTLSFVPFTGPLTMIMRIGASDIALIEIVGSLVVTVIGGIVLLWGSARIFRAGLLMYGQRMSLRRVFSALRQAG
jgi:ABC-2 type transport system permease protein